MNSSLPRYIWLHLNHLPRLHSARTCHVPLRFEQPHQSRHYPWLERLGPGVASLNGWQEFLVYLFYFELLVWYKLQVASIFSGLLGSNWPSIWECLKWRPGLGLSTCFERHLNEMEPTCIHPSRLARTWPQSLEKTKSRRCRGAGREEPVQVRATPVVKTRNPFVRSCSYVLSTCQGRGIIQLDQIVIVMACDDMRLQLLKIP